VLAPPGVRNGGDETDGHTGPRARAVNRANDVAMAKEVILRSDKRVWLRQGGVNSVWVRKECACAFPSVG